MARTKPTARLMVTRSSRTMTRARAARKKEHNAASAFLATTREGKAKSKGSTTLRKRTTKKRPTKPKSKLYSVGKKVRVWWPPTRNKKRTDFSGAYWPAKVVDSFEGGYRVEYDNQEREDVDADDVSPANPPVAFGEETTPLAEKEFCEVFNGSETDPSAWLAQIYKAEGEAYIVNFPFHDSVPETVVAGRVRRARVFDETSRTWKVIKPGQEWEDGEVASPNELELIDEVTLKGAVASLTDASTSAMKMTSDGRKYKDINSIMNGAASQAGMADVSQQTSKFVPSSRHGREGREGRSRSKRKDPHAPKKPRSAYVFFMGKDRKAVKEENPNMRPQHIMKLVGVNWAKLTAEEKVEYEEMSRADRLRYKEDMKDYVPPDTPVDEPGAKRAKMEKECIRKPLSAFTLFSKELRQKLGSEITSAEKTKKISETWREMTDDEKEVYQAAAREDKARYEKEVAEFEAEELDQSKHQQSVLMRNFAEVTAIDFQPPPLTRTGPAVPVLDEESKKTLEEFQLHQVRDEILEQFVDEAYYLLLDVWREGSERVGDAIRAYRAHVAGQERRDWRAFFTSVVGVESTTSLLKTSACTNEPTPPPTSDDDVPPAE